jgi:hypothetical protein
MTLTSRAAISRAEWTITQITGALGPERCRELALEIRAFHERFPRDVRIDAANRLLLEAMHFQAIRDGRTWHA